jgi:hypothetical protein
MTINLSDDMIRAVTAALYLAKLETNIQFGEVDFEDAYDLFDQMRQDMEAK